MNHLYVINILTSFFNFSGPVIGMKQKKKFHVIDWEAEKWDKLFWCRRSHRCNRGHSSTIYGRFFQKYEVSKDHSSWPYFNKTVISSNTTFWLQAKAHAVPRIAFYSSDEVNNEFPKLCFQVNLIKNFQNSLRTKNDENLQIRVD